MNATQTLFYAMFFCSSFAFPRWGVDGWWCHIGLILKGVDTILLREFKQPITHIYIPTLSVFDFSIINDGKNLTLRLSVTSNWFRVLNIYRFYIGILLAFCYFIPAEANRWLKSLWTGRSSASIIIIHRFIIEEDVRASQHMVF